MEYGQWTMEYGPCTMDLGPWTMDYGPWPMDYGRWTMNHGAWTLDHGPKPWTTMKVHNPWSLGHAPWLMVLMHMYLCICIYNINNIYKHNTSTYTASAQYLKRIFL